MFVPKATCLLGGVGTAGGVCFNVPFGGLGAPPAVMACNIALGKCQLGCATVALLAPTP